MNRSRSVLRHRTVAGSDLQQVLPDTPGAEHEAPGLLEQPAARAALRGLPERQREAIVLRYDAGLSEGEIAAAMGISRGAVKSHTARGLSALRAALEQASSHLPVPPTVTMPGHAMTNPEFAGLAVRPGMRPARRLTGNLISPTARCRQSAHPSHSGTTIPPTSGRVNSANATAISHHPRPSAFRGSFHS